MNTSPLVRVLEERRFGPPRRVEVEHDGAWLVPPERVRLPGDEMRP